MKKVFISTCEHFLIAADSITKIEVVWAEGERYQLRLITNDGNAYRVGNYDSESAAWSAANLFVMDFGRVVVF